MVTYVIYPLSASSFWFSTFSQRCGVKHMGTFFSSTVCLPSLSGNVKGTSSALRFSTHARESASARIFFSEAIFTFGPNMLHIEGKLLEVEEVCYLYMYLRLHDPQLVIRYHQYRLDAQARCNRILNLEAPLEILHQLLPVFIPC